VTVKTFLGYKRFRFKINAAVFHNITVFDQINADGTSLKNTSY